MESPIKIYFFIGKSWISLVHGFQPSMELMTPEGTFDPHLPASLDPARPESPRSDFLGQTNGGGAQSDVLMVYAKGSTIMHHPPRVYNMVSIWIIYRSGWWLLF